MAGESVGEQLVARGPAVRSAADGFLVRDRGVGLTALGQSPVPELALMPNPSGLPYRDFPR